MRAEGCAELSARAGTWDGWARKRMSSAWVVGLAGGRECAEAVESGRGGQCVHRRGSPRMHTASLRLPKRADRLVFFVLCTLSPSCQAAERRSRENDDQDEPSSLVPTQRVQEDPGTPVAVAGADGAADVVTFVRETPHRFKAAAESSSYQPSPLLYRRVPPTPSPPIEPETTRQQQQQQQQQPEQQRQQHPHREQPQHVFATTYPLVPMQHQREDQQEHQQVHHPEQQSQRSQQQQVMATTCPPPPMQYQLQQQFVQFQQLQHLQSSMHPHQLVQVRQQQEVPPTPLPIQYQQFYQQPMPMTPMSTQHQQQHQLGWSQQQQHVLLTQMPMQQLHCNQSDPQQVLCQEKTIGTGASASKPTSREVWGRFVQMGARIAPGTQCHYCLVVDPMNPTAHPHNTCTVRAARCLACMETRHPNGVDECPAPFRPQDVCNKCGLPYYIDGTASHPGNRMPMGCALEKRCALYVCLTRQLCALSSIASSFRKLDLREAGMPIFRP